MASTCGYTYDKTVRIESFLPVFPDPHRSFSPNWDLCPRMVFRSVFVDYQLQGNWSLIRKFKDKSKFLRFQSRLPATSYQLPVQGEKSKCFVLFHTRQNSSNILSKYFFSNFFLNIPLIYISYKNETKTNFMKYFARNKILDKCLIFHENPLF